MRKKLSRQHITVIIVIYFIIGLIFLGKCPDTINTNQFICYYTVLLSYFVVGFIWIVCVDKFGFYIFEPVNMVMVLTFISYSIEPMISIIQDDMGIGSFYVFDGCTKATLLYIVGVCIFLYSYYNGTADLVYDECSAVEAESNDRIKYAAWMFLLLAISVQMIDLMLHGFSLHYILSLGMSGSVETVEEGGLGIFGNIRYFSLTSLLYLDIYSKNKKSVWLMRILCIIMCALRGYRWIVVLYLLSPIVVNSYVKRKSPKLKTLLIIAVALIFMVGGLQFVRISLRHGTGLAGLADREFNLAYIWGAFQGNFDLYKTLYGAVTYFPDKSFYTLGQQMIYLTLATIIPRSIWPEKPYSVIEKVHKLHFMGPDAVRGAWAYAQLTEFYVEFGIIGICVCMYLMGRICKKVFVLSNREDRTVHSVVVAAFVFPMLMQFVIRGYMPLNFWPTVFMLVPVIVIKLFVSNADRI